MASDKPIFTDEMQKVVNDFGSLPRQQAIKALQFLCTQYGGQLTWNNQKVEKVPNVNAGAAAPPTKSKKGGNKPPPKKDEPELRVWRAAEKAFKVERQMAQKEKREVNPAALKSYFLSHERYFRPKAEAKGEEYVSPSFKPKKEKEAKEPEAKAADDRA